MLPSLLAATMITAGVLHMTSMAALADDPKVVDLSGTSATKPALAPEHADGVKKHLLTMADETLQRLYKENPEAKEELEKAYGYAVFSGTGFNLVFYVGGAGKGVAFDNATKTPVYMTMVRAGTGPGVGYEEYRQVLIFSNETLFKEFVTVGLQGNASANATVKMGEIDIDEGMAISLVPGVKLYQLTDKGIDIQANWGGTEYLRDPELQ